MIKRWKLLGSLVVATAGISLWVSSCGGGGSSTPITEAMFCQQKAEKECQVTTRCGTASPAVCATQRTAICMAFVNATKSTTRPFHPENVAACVNKANSVYTKSTAITPTELADLDDVCNYVFHGSSTAACTVKYECATTSQICDKGNCAARVVKNANDLCGNPGEICAAGSYCAHDPANAALFRCLPKAAQSAPCSADIPCLEALRCDPTSSCQPRANATESCVTSADCVTGAPYCDPYIGNRCDSGLSFSGGAAACADYGGGASTGVGGSTGGNDAATGG